MFRFALPLENMSLELSPRWGQLGVGWSVFLLALLALVPVLLVLLLSRYEMLLVRRRVAGVLLLLRLLVIAALWFVVGFEPTVARYRQKEVPSQVIVAVDLSGSMEVVDVDRKDSLPRRDLARKVLLEDGLLQQLGQNHDVKLLGFHGDLWKADPKKPEELFATSAGKDAGNNLATNLQLPLERGAEQTSAAVLGLVLLTDGQHNTGPSPLERVKDFGRPIYPVIVGAKQPPADVAVVEVRAPDNAFKDTEVKVEARIRVTGLPAQDFLVELLQKGKVVSPEHKKTLKAGQERVRFQVKLEELGTHHLEVKVRPTLTEPKEITQANNSMTRAVRVTQDRAKVLVVDDEARWEFHYLVNALLRDKTPNGEATLQVDRVLFHQPRLGLISEENLEKIKNPWLKLPVFTEKDQKEDPLFRYDLIILGDVAGKDLSGPDRQRLEKYVAQRGGTLVLQSGRRSWPMEYLKPGSTGMTDPLVKMLPINDAWPMKPKAGFVLAMTTEGQERPFLQMEPDPGRNQQFWSEMPRHFWGVVGKGKPGATVLAIATENPVTAADRDRLEKEQGLVVTMPYGFGQVVHVGLDSTWRWRYRVGDVYHHHFWGQLVRWVAAERLLPAGNEYVRYGTRAAIYRQGKEVDVTVRLTEKAGLLPPEATPAVRMVRLLPEGKEEKMALVPLQAKEHQPSELQGKVGDLPPGEYRIDLEIPGLEDKLPAMDSDMTSPKSNTFTVLPPQEEEMLDLAANWNLLAALAQESGGELFTPDTAGDLVDRLRRQVSWEEVFDREHVWQDEPLVWWMFGILLALLSLEWVVRKGAGLP